MTRTLEEAFPELLNIWTVLEAITVSLDRIGAYAAIKDADRAHDALWAFFEPALFQRIALARRQLVEILTAIDPEADELTERLAEDEDAIGYWQGQGLGDEG